MLRSLLDASLPDDRYEVICLVSEEIPQRQKDKLDRLHGERIRFRYINLAGRLQGVYVDPRYSEAASFRLLLPEILPEYDKVLYIDCDVIVRNNLSALYKSIDLDGSLLAVVYEAPIEHQSERWAALGCDPSKYFNSGFLLMNLKQMREDGISAKLLDACRVDWLEFPDQDALNQVCKGRVLPLSPLYNSIRTFFLPQYKPEFVAQYSEDLWDEVQRSGNIHYTGGKPWNLFTVKFGEWWKVYETLPQEIKDEWTPDPKAMRMWKLYRNFAGRFCIDAAQYVYRKIKH